MAKLLVIATYFAIVAVVAAGILSGHDISTLVQLRATNVEYQKQIQDVLQSSFQDRLAIAKSMAAETWIPKLADWVRGGTPDQFTATIVCERADNPFRYMLGRGDLIAWSDLDDAAGNVFNCAGQ